MRLCISRRLSPRKSPTLAWFTQPAGAPSTIMQPGGRPGRREAFRGSQQHGLDGIARGGRGKQRAPTRAALGLAVELDGFAEQVFL